MVDGTPMNVGLWLVPNGAIDYDRLRPLSYPQTGLCTSSTLFTSHVACIFLDVFVVLCAVNQPDSLTSIVKKWLPELQHHCPSTPFVIGINKCDLRDDPKELQKLKQEGHHFVSREEVKSLLNSGFHLNMCFILSRRAGVCFECV